MVRSTLRIIPTCDDSSDSDSSTLSGTPITPQFFRVMREYRNNGPPPPRRQTYIVPLSPQQSARSISSFEENQRIKCQNKWLLRCPFLCIFSVFLGCFCA